MIYENYETILMIADRRGVKDMNIISVDASNMEFITAKTIISGYAENNSWFGNNYNMNIYKGCSHGCIYCDSRSECYRVDNFDRVRAKKNALSIIERELKARELWNLFQCKCTQYSILYKMDDIIRGYKDLYTNIQLSLF